MNNTLPLISIITPAYNRASYLDETIRSVLEQDYSNLEYIVLDDGSTDNTREVLERYTGRLSWETHANMGETQTVNKGWGMANGDLVAVVNSDDPLLPGAVSTMVNFMQAHPDILVAYPNWIMIDTNSEVIKYMELPEYDYLHMLKTHSCIVGPGAFIRRKAFELTGLRDPGFKYVADLEYWLRLGLYGPFARIPKTLATFRVHPASASVAHQGKTMAEEHIRLIQKFYACSDLPPEILNVRAEAFSSAYLLASQTCGTEREFARLYYLKNFLCYPPGLWQRYGLKFALFVGLPRLLFAMLVVTRSKFRQIFKKCI